MAALVLSAFLINQLVQNLDLLLLRLTNRSKFSCSFWTLSASSSTREVTGSAPMLLAPKPAPTPCVPAFSGEQAPTRSGGLLPACAGPNFIGLPVN